MHLFSKTVTVETPALTASVAQSIYESLKQTNNKEETISTGMFYPEHVLDTNNEIQALEEVAHEAMMRIEKTWKEQVGYDDKTMKPIYEERYIAPSPTSRKELEDEMASDILDISTFVSDYMDYVLVYKENTTWADFVEQFDYLKSQQDVI